MISWTLPTALSVNCTMCFKLLRIRAGLAPYYTKRTAIFHISILWMYYPGPGSRQNEVQRGFFPVFHSSNPQDLLRGPSFLAKWLQRHRQLKPENRGERRNRCMGTLADT